MRSTDFTAVLFACMTALVAAAPVPVISPLYEEPRKTSARGDDVAVARSPSPHCLKMQCW
ncbi:hypothetical protein M413DRAFT_28808 [Hebeloma cylindrosporum]|uniref:Uncharacterized protein n=1 Tax=Hebeloma cylindrosporum TaxID=76867 RepID=A0A0C2XRM5_HEBCY|nr:hypothetical protein M413DRAFT_28808 [Hebeloma cylindrosporum h7]